MKTLNNYIEEQMKDNDFSKEYTRLKPEFEIIKAVVNARNKMHLTHEDLSKLTGIAQADISKIERGTRNPSLNMLKRLADGMGMDIEIKFVKKHKQTNKIHEQQISTH